MTHFQAITIWPLPVLVNWYENQTPFRLECKFVWWDRRLPLHWCTNRNVPAQGLSWAQWTHSSSPTESNPAALVSDSPNLEPVMLNDPWKSLLLATCSNLQHRIKTVLCTQYVYALIEQHTWTFRNNRTLFERLTYLICVRVFTHACAHGG